MIPIKTSLENKYIIDLPKYVPVPPRHLQLQDKVLVYNNGFKWRIIPLEIMKNYPIIYDKVYEKYYQTRINNKYNKVTTDITISYCPYTSVSIIYEGVYELDSNVYNNNIVLVNKNTNEKFVQLIGQCLISNKCKKRWEVKQMTLKNALKSYPDCEYLFTDLPYSYNFVPKNYNTISKIYYPLTNTNDKINKKTLIYGIVYNSSTTKSNNLKYVAIIGKNMSYDIEENGIQRYLEKHESEIREKFGFIIPCFWFIWYDVFPTTKIIQL